MKKTKTVVLFHNSKSLKNLKIKRKIKEIQSFLNKKNIKTFVTDKQAEPSLPKSSLIVSLGGDGTYLNAVKHAKDIPILGVNMGSLGFLTPHSDSSALFMIENFFKGKHHLEKNCFLKAVLKKNLYQKLSSKEKKQQLKQGKKIFKKENTYNLKSQNFIAVNDIVIERGSFNHLIKLSVFINKEFAYSLKSDGIIISSPLGSTAYNLAAGGPILDTKVACLVVTPICSHALTNRPLVISNKSEIELILENTKAYLTVDGLTQCEISAHSQVHIKKDRKSFLSVVDKEPKSYVLLKQKLRFGQRD